jgi:hypothetical protein
MKLRSVRLKRRQLHCRNSLHCRSRELPLERPQIRLQQQHLWHRPLPPLSVQLQLRNASPVLPPLSLQLPQLHVTSHCHLAIQRQQLLLQWLQLQLLVRVQHMRRCPFHTSQRSHRRTTCKMERLPDSQSESETSLIREGCSASLFFIARTYSATIIVVFRSTIVHKIVENVCSCCRDFPSKSFRDRVAQC